MEVVSVTQGEPGDRAGVQEGWTILRIGDHSVNSQEEYVAALAVAGKVFNMTLRKPGVADAGAPAAGRGLGSSLQLRLAFGLRGRGKTTPQRRRDSLLTVGKAHGSRTGLARASGKGGVA